ncbi:MAG: ornithine carbamoyltransferase [Euryarchaeota archaeon]|nr:ornithine carbamoyltransferase [Euryarchaeota archaeon]
MRDLISMADAKGSLDDILSAAAAYKADPKAVSDRRPLAGKAVALIFEKTSTRTRVSFERGVSLLGAQPIVLNKADTQFGRGESIADTARVLSRYCDALVYRTFEHSNVEELAAHAGVPVINSLSNREHPCQVLADLLTIKEKKGRLKGLRFAYVGDGNNMCNSYLLGGALAGMHVTVAAPDGYTADPEVAALACELASAAGGSITETHDPKEAVEDVDVVATDTWVSMGDEGEKEERIAAFKGYTVDSDLMGLADKEAIFLHCMPAYYGYEVSEEVAYGPQSVMFDEAENRLWAQMAVMTHLLGVDRQRPLAQPVKKKAPVKA